MADRSDGLSKRCTAGIGLTALILLSACGGRDDRTGNTAAIANGAAIDGNASGVAAIPSGPPGRSTKATPQQNQWLQQAMAFMQRPEQQRDVQAAIRARAMTHPLFCPAAVFAPKRINILFDPEPQFDASGTMQRGTIVQSFIMRNCTAPVQLNLETRAMPGLPLRFVAGLAGTTFAEPALQEKAIPYAVAAAKPLASGCATLTPVDTHRNGGPPGASGVLMPWSEEWLMSGCGTLVSVTLHFTPDTAARQTLIRADPAESRLARMTGAAPAATPAPAVAGAPRTVATATGTSAIPIGGADIPGAKVAGTCLYQLRKMPATAPDHAECLSGLPARAGAAIQCSASRGAAQGRMDVAVTTLDAAAGSLTFACTVRAR